MKRAKVEVYTRLWLDNIPQSKERLQAIREWFPKEERKDF